MESKLVLHLRRLGRTMWLRSAAMSVLAILAALVSIFATPYLPEDLSRRIGADALDHILGIIASSMLTVTTFSLGITVTAYYSAASAATPRASTLLVEDTTTQNVLATFVGAFLFSLIGIVVLRTGAYGEQGRVGLYLVTIIVIVIIVAQLLRWIDHLTTIGRMGDTLKRVEKATMNAIRARLDAPYLGCTPLPEGYRLAHGNHPIFAPSIGYVQHVDTAALADHADKWKMQIAISALPGTFADPAREIAFSENPLDEAQTKSVVSCFTIGSTRTFEQDPRFGIIVLSEIASRALSPAVNDPGTAIDVIGRLVRILHTWSEDIAPTGEADIKHERLFAPGLRTEDLFNDAFTSIARDGAGIIEVNIRLQKAFAAIAVASNEKSRENAARLASLVLTRAQASLELNENIDIIRRLHQEVVKLAPVNR